MLEKRVDFTFEEGEIKRINKTDKDISDYNELEAYIEEKNKQNVFETIRDYFNLDFLKRFYLNFPTFLRKTKKLYSNILFYKPISF